jgi:hypothetical protein
LGPIAGLAGAAGAAAAGFSWRAGRRFSRRARRRPGQAGVKQHVICVPSRGRREPSRTSARTTTPARRPALRLGAADTLAVERHALGSKKGGLALKQRRNQPPVCEKLRTCSAGRGWTARSLRLTRRWRRGSVPRQLSARLAANMQALLPCVGPRAMQPRRETRTLRGVGATAPQVRTGRPSCELTHAFVRSSGRTPRAASHVHVAECSCDVAHRVSDLTSSRVLLAAATRSSCGCYSC